MSATLPGYLRRDPDGRAVIAADDLPTECDRLTDREREALQDLTDRCGLPQVVGALIEHLEAQARIGERMGCPGFVARKTAAAEGLRRVLEMAEGTR